MPDQRRSDAGFTLVEMAVTVMLLGVISAFAVSGYQGYAQSRAQDGAAESLREVLRQAQQRAVTEGQSMCVEFSTSSWQVYRGACDNPDRTPLGVAGKLDHGVRFIDPEFLTAAGSTITGVTFRSRGTASPGSVTLRRTGSETERVLQVEGFTGRVVVS